MLHKLIHTIDDSAKVDANVTWRTSLYGKEHPSQTDHIRCAIEACLFLIHSHDIGRDVWIVRGEERTLFRNTKCSNDVWQFCTCDAARSLQRTERQLMELKDGEAYARLINGMTSEEFKRHFNSPGDAIEELKDLLFCTDRSPVHGKTSAEVQADIDLLERACNLLTTVKMSRKAKLQDIEDNASDEEKKEIRKRDKSYKPKPVAIDTPMKAKGVTKGKDEKMRETMRGLGMNESDIEAHLIKQRLK